VKKYLQWKCFFASILFCCSVRYSFQYTSSSWEGDIFYYRQSERQTKLFQISECYRSEQNRIWNCRKAFQWKITMNIQYSWNRLQKLYKRNSSERDFCRSLNLTVVSYSEYLFKKRNFSYHRKRTSRKRLYYSVSQIPLLKRTHSRCEETIG